jgi:hypothetical protein
MPSAWFEPAIPATKLPQIYALDGAATWVGPYVRYERPNCVYILGGHSIYPVNSRIVRLTYIQLVQQLLFFKRRGRFSWCSVYTRLMLPYINVHSKVHVHLCNLHKVESTDGVMRAHILCSAVNINNIDFQVLYSTQ